MLKAIGSFSSSQGIFTVHVDATTDNSLTTESDNWWWTPAGQLTNKTTCENSEYKAPYTYFTWTQASSGNFDIYFFGYNNSNQNWDFSVGMYNASPYSLPFIGTGDETNPSSGCNTSKNFSEIS